MPQRPHPWGTKPTLPILRMPGCKEQYPSRYKHKALVLLNDMVLGKCWYNQQTFINIHFYAVQRATSPYPPGRHSTLSHGFSPWSPLESYHFSSLPYTFSILLTAFISFCRFLFFVETLPSKAAVTQPPSHHMAGHYFWIILRSTLKREKTCRVLFVISLLFVTPGLVFTLLLSLLNDAPPSFYFSAPDSFPRCGLEAIGCV